VHGAGRDAQHRGGLLNGQPAEEAQLDDAGLARILDGQPIEGDVDGEQVGVALDRRQERGQVPHQEAAAGGDLAELGDAPGEYLSRYGLTSNRLALASPDAVIMHPGPMNRGIEIEDRVADHPDRSLIAMQVEMGVAVRMACLELVLRDGASASLSAPSA